ncbi:hypothetical protein BN1864_LIB5394:06258 [Pseudomonas sp. 1 R 17]|nr:hypothetical protein BN1864_LIB5394:06258 [Pseudomonas sp. 1 R 17]
MGQAVGLAVQLAITQGLRIELDRHRSVVFGGAVGNHFVYQTLGREAGVSLVPQLQDVSLLILAQQVELADGLLLVGNHRLQQVLPVAGHALNSGWGKQIGGVAQGGTQGRLAFLHVQCQVELGHAFIPAQHLDVQFGEALQVIGCRGHAMVEHHLEQWAQAHAALGLQRFDQLLERQVLVGLGFEGTLAYLLQQLHNAHLPVDIGLEHLGIDEETDQPLGFQAIAVGNRHPDTHVFLAAVAVQQRLVGRQQHHRQRHSGALRQATQTGQQLRLQLDAQASAAMALHGRAQVVERQFQHRLHTAQLLTPVGQLTGLLSRLHPLALPHGIVGVLDRQGRQGWRLPVAEGGVQLHQLLDHQLHRPAIGDDMVLHQHQHMFVLGQAQQPGPQQRPAQQVEWLRNDVSHPCLEAGFIGVDQIDFNQARVFNHLDRTGGVLAQMGAQAFMACQQGVEAALQRRQVQRACQTQGAGDVVRGAFGVELPEEPLAFLGIRQQQRLAAIGLEQRRRDHALLTQGHHEVTQQWVFEQGLERHFQRQCLAHPRYHPRSQQRMPAQLEEMVVKADLGHAQHLGPDRRDLLFARGDGGHMAFQQQAGIDLGQGLTVELAVGGQGQAVEEHHVRRHHVVRQALTQGRCVGLRRLCRRRHQVGDQAVVVGQHHGFANAFMLAQAGFDFAQFDTETAHLDLMVDPADVLHHAVGTVACQVAGAVQALARRAVRVGHETLGGEGWPRVVAACQADAADQQFTGRTHRAWTEPGIEDEQRGVGDRAPDQRLRLQQAMGRRPNGGFGGTIEVPYRALQVEHALGQIGRQRFAAAQALDTAQHIGTWAFQQHTPGGRRGLQYAGGLGGDQVDYRLRVQRQFLTAQQHRGADCQRHVQLQGKDVERERRQRQHPRLRADVQGAGHAAGKAAQRLVRHHHALGLAGGAGGVDHIGQVLRRDADLRVVFVTAGVLDQKHLQALRLHQAPNQRRLSQQHLGAAVFEHEGQALRRELRVQRHIGATGLEGRKQADHHVQGTLHMHRHPHVRANARRDQAMGQAVGAAVEFAVAHGLAIKLQRDGVRLCQGLCFEQLVDTALAWVVDGRVVPVFDHLLPLRWAEHRQFVQGLGGIVDHCAQQVLPVHGQALQGGGVEQVGGVGQGCPKAVDGLLGFQVEVELGRVTGPIHRLQSQARQLHRAGAQVVLVIEHHLEQRVMAETAFRLQRFYQLFERQVLMGLGFQGTLLDLGQ